MAVEKKTPPNDDATQSTEASSVYDTILSTCCCAGTASGENSFKEDKIAAKDKDKDEDEIKKKPQQQQEYVEEGFDETPKFWERIGDVALLLLGGAPPVKFVKCFECASVDGSVLTLPKVLCELAEEHDKKNKKTVNSIWSISEDATDGTDHANAAYINGNNKDSYLNNRSRSGKRWGDRLRLKSSSSFDNRSGIASTEDSYLHNMRMSKMGTDGIDAPKVNRGTVIKHRIRSSMTGRTSSGVSRTSQRSTSQQSTSQRSTSQRSTSQRFKKSILIEI